MRSFLALGSLLLVNAVAAELPTAEFIIEKYKLVGFTSAVYTPEGELDRIEGGRRLISDPTPIESTDRWQLADNSKILTALLIARLAVQGKIDLERPIKEVLDYEMDPGFDALILTDLIILSGGMEDATQTVKNNYPLLQRLMEESNFDADFDQTAARLDLAKFYLTQPPNSELQGYPTDFTGFTIGVSVLESITGMTWEQMIQDEVFTPLGIEGCGFGPNTLDPSLPPKQPWGHLAGAFGIYHLPITPGPQAESPSVFTPSTGINCDMDSFGKIMVAYINQPEDFLPAETWDTLTNVVASDALGAGMYIYDLGPENGGRVGISQSAPGHQNSNVDYAAFYILFDLKLAVVLRANQDNVEGMRSDGGLALVRDALFAEATDTGLGNLLNHL